MRRYLKAILEDSERYGNYEEVRFSLAVSHVEEHLGNFNAPNLSDEDIDEIAQQIVGLECKDEWVFEQLCKSERYVIREWLEEHGYEVV